METESHNRIHSRPRFLSSIIAWRFLAVIVMRFCLIAEFGLIAKFFARFRFWFRRSLSTFAFSSFIVVIVLWCFSNQFSSFPSLLFICLSYIVVFVIVFCRFCQTNSLHCWQCICLFCSVVNQYSSFPSLPSPLRSCHCHCHFLTVANHLIVANQYASLPLLPSLLAHSSSHLLQPGGTPAHLHRSSFIFGDLLEVYFGAFKVGPI